MPRKDVSRVAKRIQLDLTPQAKERLQRLQDKMDAMTYSEVFKRAIMLMEHVVDAGATGKQLGYVEERDGEQVFHSIDILY